ncbi:hypothetical protein [Parendozoicomonas haliclonae]|uniref:Uncharacterized protein n=1 Tax=Parendozoicomonas haliclonae TaxID=1960125 RepID=A0A1X7AEA3_9GAMM|nr:hypothetical protein [Parendozoicomonas haliclonae]SMA32621.1 hypothetical protein EHSB41UT_00169 [Parendozoicomonas haliclonae]
MTVKDGITPGFIQRAYNELKAHNVLSALKVLITFGLLKGKTVSEVTNPEPHMKHSLAELETFMNLEQRDIERKEVDDPEALYQEYLGFDLTKVKLQKTDTRDELEAHRDEMAYKAQDCDKMAEMTFERDGASDIYESYKKQQQAFEKATAIANRRLELIAAKS